MSSSDDEEENRYRPAPVYDNSYRTKETPKVNTDMRPPIPVKREPQKSPAVKKIVATLPKKVFHASVPTKKVVRAPSIVKKVVRAPSVAKRVIKAPAVVKKAVQQRTPVKKVVIPQTAVKKEVQSSKAVKQVAKPQKAVIQVAQSPKAVKQVAQSPTAVKQAVPAPAAVKNPAKAQPVAKIQEKLVAKESDVKLGIAVKQAVPAPAAVKNPEKAPPVDKIQEKVEIATKEPDVKPGNVTEEHDDSKVEQRYELSPVMSRALEVELQQIMIKVWQQLPDTTTSAADGLLVDKLRNDAGDDLRNVLGLNVTKRILNIHNTLLVKVALQSRPDHGLWMKAFVIKFRIVKFKYAHGRKTLFTAQLARIEDFDRLCDADGSKYGGVKLRVTPVYNFMKCPEKIKIKTILTTEEEKKLAKEKQSTDIIGEKSNDQQTKLKVETNVEPKSAANNAVIGTRNASENKKPVQTVEIAPKNTETVDTAVKSDKTVPGKIAKTSKSDTSVKTVPAKTANTSKPETTVKAVPAETANTSKPDTTVKTIPAKTANTSKPNTTAKTIPAKPNNTTNPDTTAKTIPAKVTNTGKPDTTVKTDKPVPAETATTSKPDSAVKTGKNAPVNTAAKTDKNAPAKTATPNKPKTALKTENNESKETYTKGIATKDNKKDSNENSHTKNTEEPMDIDPNDFLAMMEQGIVLDECTGSDDE